jgi:epoxyqueuosine reductase
MMTSIENLLNTLVEKFSIASWGYSESAGAETYPQFRKWLDDNLHGSLSYLEDHRAELRESLSYFYPEFKSSIVFAFSYAHVAQFLEEHYKTSKSNGLKIASYSCAFDGIDYHHYIKNILIKIGKSLQKEIEGLDFRISLDVHPILERDLAVRSGLGWFGKNSMFISKSHGSFLMLGIILLSESLELPIKNRVLDHCGTCDRCIRFCPTKAIQSNRTIDASKCISTYTIEQFNDLEAPPKGFEDGAGEIFGCDICQTICPWNKKLLSLQREHQIELPSVLNRLVTEDLDLLVPWIDSMSNREYRRVFKGTALERTGRVGLLKNMLFWKEKAYISRP